MRLSALPVALRLTRFRVVLGAEFLASIVHSIVPIWLFAFPSSPFQYILSAARVITEADLVTLYVEKEKWSADDLTDMRSFFAEMIKSQKGEREGKIARKFKR